MVGVVGNIAQNAVAVRQAACQEERDPVADSERPVDEAPFVLLDWLLKDPEAVEGSSTDWLLDGMPWSNLRRLPLAARLSLASGERS